MASNVKKLKKVDVNLLRQRLKGQSPILSKLSNLPIQIDTENLLSNRQFLIFLGSFSIFLIFAVLDLFLFISNMVLRHEYEDRLIQIKPYNQRIEVTNKELSLLRNNYEKLNDTISSFKDMNNILSKYYSYYNSYTGLINFAFYNITKTYSYIQNTSFKARGNVIPNSFSFTISMENPSYSDDIWYNLKQTNGCYDIGVAGICLNSIMVNKNLKLNKFGFSYFETVVNLKGNFISKINEGKKNGK